MQLMSQKKNCETRFSPILRASVRATSKGKGSSFIKKQSASRLAEVDIADWSKNFSKVKTSKKKSLKKQVGHKLIQCLESCETFFFSGRGHPTVIVSMQQWQKFFCSKLGTFVGTPQIFFKDVVRIKSSTAMSRHL